MSVELQPVKESLERLEGKIEALENDIKDIYDMLSDIRKAAAPSGDISKQTHEEKIRQTHTMILQVAKQAGVKL